MTTGALDPFRVRELLGPTAAPAHRVITGEHGVALPAFVDHHVHVHLVDESRIVDGGIAAVLDNGGDPVALARRDPDGMPRVRYAGAFLTVPGGYPSGLAWAPAAMVREVASASLHPGAPGGAATAVDEQASFGASIIKVALNARTGPVFDAETLAAVVAAAARHGLPVVAHAEGDGMTRLAIDAQVAALAHAPFTELVDDALIARAVAAGQRWISTLDAHRGDAADDGRARANLAAFAAAGGTVLYGTDIGAEQTGIDVREAAALHEAGLQGAALISALTDPWPDAEGLDAVVTFIAGPGPESLDDVPRWLGGAAVVPADELTHDGA